MPYLSIHITTFLIQRCTRPLFYSFFKYDNYLHSRILSLLSTLYYWHYIIVTVLRLLFSSYMQNGTGNCATVSHTLDVHRSR